jgi:hypothetical protein
VLIQTEKFVFKTLNSFQCNLASPYCKKKQNLVHYKHLKCISPKCQLRKLHMFYSNNLQKQFFANHFVITKNNHTYEVSLKRNGSLLHIFLISQLKTYKMLIYWIRSASCLSFFLKKRGFTQLFNILLTLLQRHH